MNSNKKVLWGVIVIVIVILVVWAIRNKTPATNTSGGNVIKIGLVGPMSRGAAVYGQGLAKSIQMANEDLKGTKNTYQLVIEDDASKPAQSASAAQKLINIDKVQALLTVTSGTGNAIKPIATAAHIPQICACSDDTVADGQYNFTNEILPDSEATTWLAYATAHGIKKISVMYQNQPGFNLIIGNLISQAAAAGVTVVYKEQDDPTQTDFKTSIAKALAVKPDSVLIAFFPPQLEIIGKELKDAGVTNVTGVATFAISSDTSLFEGKWYSDSALADKDFSARFTSEFPDTRFNVRVAPYAYDSFNMIVKGFESGGSVTDYLSKISSYAGKAGNLTQENGSGIFRSPVGIWQIKDGKPVEIQ